jgi:hypothetical protein
MRRELSQEARDLAAARVMLVVVDFLGRGHTGVRVDAELEVEMPERLG